jgi:sulfide:quinone oxidoreductase
MADKTILVLGGGMGGIVTARELRRHLGNRQHRVVVIDKNNIHSFAPSFLWVMVGWRKPEALQKPLSALEKYGIEFHHSEIKRIATDERVVETERSRFRYDYLVVSLGAELVFEQIPGSSSDIGSFYTLDQAAHLHANLLRFRGGTISIVVSSLPCSCPTAPYEAAMLLQSYFFRRGITDVKIRLFTPEPTPIAVTGEKVGQAIRELLEQRGIEFCANHQLLEIDPLKHRLSFQNGSSQQYDLGVVVPPQRAPSVVRKGQLVDKSGGIPVDARTMRTCEHNVFALGDVTTILLANGGILPKLGTFALDQAEIVAYNIAEEIWSRSVQKEFTGNGFCFLEAGNSKAGYIHGNFLVRPEPRVTITEPNVTFHWGKVVYEKYWLWRWL